MTTAFGSHLDGDSSVDARQTNSHTALGSFERGPSHAIAVREHLGRVGERSTRYWP